MTLPRTPCVYTPQQLQDQNTQVQTSSGRWVPARGLSYPGLNLLRRARVAYRVFTGRYDALDWGPGDVDRNGQWTEDTKCKVTKSE